MPRTNFTCQKLEGQKKKKKVALNPEIKYLGKKFYFSNPNLLAKIAIKMLTINYFFFCFNIILMLRLILGGGGGSLFTKSLSKYIILKKSMRSGKKKITVIGLF